MSDEERRMRPVVVLPIGAVSKKDLKRLNDNFICAIEAKDPSAVRFIDPPMIGYDAQEWAAIELVRVVVGNHPGIATLATRYSPMELGKLYADILMAGKPRKKVAEVEKVKKVTP